MAHTHDVYDMENHFEINGSSRFIRETSATKLVVVQGDHRSEIITFKMPRFIDGHDMTLCNRIRVHYNNVDTATNDKSDDIYEVTDLKVCEDDENMLTFTWEIEAVATKYAGTLTFSVKFQCVEGDNILYEWNTAKYVGTNVLAGINNSEEFVEKYSNVLEQWHNELARGADSIEEFAEKSMADIGTAKEDAVEDINEAKAGAIDSVEDAKEEAIDAIDNAIANGLNENWRFELAPVVEQLKEEVLDAREGCYGENYGSLGSAIRSQIANLTTIATDPKDHYYWKTFNYSGEDKTFVFDEDLKNGDTFRNGDDFTFRYLAKDKDLVEIVYVKSDGEEVVPDWSASSGEYEEVYLLSVEGYVEIRVNSYVEVEHRTRIGTVQDLKLEVEELKANGSSGSGGDGKTTVIMAGLDYEEVKDELYIYQLTKEEYKSESEKGHIYEDALYLTPQELVTHKWNGTKLEITSDSGTTTSPDLKGEKGDNGKSAYEYAKEKGYTGTEDEFANQMLLVASIVDGNGVAY